MKCIFVLVVISLICSVAAFSTDKAQPVLPQVFAGWERSARTEVSNNPGAADPVYGEVLKEYGFADFHHAVYTRPDRKLDVKAIRFKDASGAYGAFTFYKTPEMQTETIGDQGSSANERVLFYRGNILVEATLDRVTAMSAGELRELAASLPLPSGPARNLPVLPTYLPKQGYIRNTAKYVTGPLALANARAPLPAELINFPAGAEVVTGQYHTGEGVATLTLISYPTPQIAADRLRAIEEALPVQQANNNPKARVASKRSGPVVAMISGAISGEEARNLLAAINYDADVTWSEAVPTGKNDPRSLLWSLAMLTIVLLGLALVAGVAFGGIRIMIKKLYPDRVFDRPEDVEIIQLRLR